MFVGVIDRGGVLRCVGNRNLQVKEDFFLSDCEDGEKMRREDVLVFVVENRTREELLQLFELM